MSLNQPVLLVGVVSGLLAGLLAPSLVPLLLTLFLVTLAWVLFCATTFLRAGHNFIRDGEMPPRALRRWCCCASSAARWRCWCARSGCTSESAGAAQAGRLRPHAEEAGVASVSAVFAVSNRSFRGQIRERRDATAFPGRRALR